MQGLKNTFYDGIAFRIEFAIVIILVYAGMQLSVSLIVSILLTISILRVLDIEPLNSAFEAEVIRFTTEQHTFSAITKYAGISMILMAFINFVFVSGIVFFDIIFNIS